MNVLVTAIGSMSSECVLKSLSAQGFNRIVGCDTHPREWLAPAVLVDSFHRVVPCSKPKTYIDQLLIICAHEHIHCLLPLTDLEIDVIARHRVEFEQLGVLLCMPSDETLQICRDKWQMHEWFGQDTQVNVIPSVHLSTMPPPWSLPWLIKPRHGRSSEGLVRVYDDATFMFHVARLVEHDHVVQPLHEDGEVFVVDIVRDQSRDNWAAIARHELMRTGNGAGLTVRICNDPVLLQHAGEVACKAGVHGCINIEFLRVSDNYLLMDINPRVSAGVAFSALAGYDMVLNHMRCHLKQPIEPAVACQPAIMAKRYAETLLPCEEDA